ncbi:hypothetical protein JCM24511_08877 [Saitozyma sp. JCM 24511]|nr:hypothetical protein JCM24511_08877 [Saitozyma sp. JCM 24511]
MTRPDGYAPTGTRPRDEDGNHELDEAEAQPQSPKRSKRSGVKHISRACDSCKSRSKPNPVKDLRNRIDSLMELLSQKSAPLAPPPVSTSGSIPPGLTGEQSQPAEPQHSLAVEAEAPTDIADFLAGLITVPPPVATTISPDCAATSQARSTVSPVANLGNRPVAYSGDRLKRPEIGSVMQFGPTSLWSYARDSAEHRPYTASAAAPDLLPGDWIDWARPLPPNINLSKTVHDAALAIFGAYIGAWCMVVDMPTFMRDLDICNLVTRQPRPSPPPTRTGAYSPLLHNCVLYLGLHLRRDDWPDVAQAMDAVMDEHCAALVMGETEDPNTSTLLALTLFATCLNVRKTSSSRNTGYIHFGMAFASLQALGVNISSDHLVASGSMTAAERDARNASYWTVFQQDALRAVAAGRPPMLGAPTDVSLPCIDPVIDAAPWYSVNPSKIGISNGLSGMRSTVFHWSARLHCILRKVLDTSLYSVIGDASNRDVRVVAIAHELETWTREQPFSRPTSYPLPHVLLMHMMSQLIQIYLFRPYYRSQLDISPTPAERCGQAAGTVADLLRLYDAEHGLRNGVATLIPIVFGAATVYLLRLVSNEVEPRDLKNLEESIRFMGELAVTWIEARRGLEVINTLRSEWLPDSVDSSAGTRVQNPSVPVLDQSEELPKELHEWLMGTTYYDILQGSEGLDPDLLF